MTQNQFEIGDIIIWQRQDSYCIRIIININMIFKYYDIKVLKYSKCAPLLYNQVSFDWTHDHHTKLTDLEKIKYL